MRYFNKKLLMFTLMLVLGACMVRLPVEAKEAAMSENEAAWLKTCQVMGENLHAKGFRYSNSGVKKSYKAALASKKKKSNCALYVSWCLQEYGVLKKGQTFHVKHGGKIKKNFSKWDKSKVQVIKKYKKTSSAGLQAGDVVCWAGVPHACIYAGRNNDGDRVWYDGGKVATSGNRSGARYKAFKARHLGYLDHRKISYIIRIKDL